MAMIIAIVLVRAAGSLGIDTLQAQLGSIEHAKFFEESRITGQNWPTHSKGDYIG